MQISQSGFKASPGHAGSSKHLSGMHWTSRMLEEGHVVAGISVLSHNHLGRLVAGECLTYEA